MTPPKKARIFVKRPVSEKERPPRWCSADSEGTTRRLCDRHTGHSPCRGSGVERVLERATAGGASARGSSHCAEPRAGYDEQEHQREHDVADLFVPVERHEPAPAVLNF